MAMSNKDWVGGTNSIYTTLGASNHTSDDRADGDYYATDPKAIDALMKIRPELKGQKIWEPACGAGHLSKRLSTYGCEVVSTDLYDRGFGKSGVNFLKTTELRAPIIITNPPYKYALEFATHALSDFNPKVDRLYMFLKLTFLEGQRRRLFFEQYPPKSVAVFSKRIAVAKNGNPKKFKESSAACYAWFEWERGFRNNPTIEWI